jgi:hypothetical protein
MNRNYTLLIFIFNALITNGLSAQYFYHHEDFLSDANFINKHNIKVVNIGIPSLMEDTLTDIVPYQKLCYNPFGKLAWYEYDTTINTVKRKYYTWHFYDDNARKFKSRVFQRCNDIDSLREEIRYEYNRDGKLLTEMHYQIYILAYREWSFSYDWQDTIKIRVDDYDIADTSKLDNLGREIDFTRDSIRYLVEFDEKGRRKKVEYFNVTDKGEFVKNDELNFFYKPDDMLEKVVTMSREIIYKYENGVLPSSSVTRDKFSGQQIGHEITYEYEYRDPSLSTN